MVCPKYTQFSYFDFSKYFLSKIVLFELSYSIALYRHDYVYIQANVKRIHGTLMTVGEFILNTFSAICLDETYVRIAA